MRFWKCKFQSCFTDWYLQILILMIMSSDECHKTLLMISQHWFRWWLGAVRQQAITWASVDQDLQCHMASLGPNELNLGSKRMTRSQHHFVGLVQEKRNLSALTMELCLSFTNPSIWGVHGHLAWLSLPILEQENLVGLWLNSTSSV